MCLIMCCMFGIFRFIGVSIFIVLVVLVGEVMVCEEVLGIVRL